MTWSKPLALESVANPRLIRAIHNPHQFSMWGDEETHFCDELRINHYWSRSIEELTEKLRRGDAWFRRERLIDWHRIAAFNLWRGKSPEISQQRASAAERRWPRYRDPMGKGASMFARTCVPPITEDRNDVV